MNVYAKRVRTVCSKLNRRISKPYANLTSHHEHRLVIKTNKKSSRQPSFSLINKVNGLKYICVICQKPTSNVKMIHCNTMMKPYVAMCTKCIKKK